MALRGGGSRDAVSLGAATTPYKIQCNKGSVLIGDREFLSATEALEAYISQYEGRGLFSSTATYKRTVTDLFNPKSSLLMTAERSLQTGVRATEQELNLADTKQSINESFARMKKTVTLQSKVEEALNKSQELLRQVEGDDEAPPTCPSDVGSLNTDVLLSIDPVKPSWQSKHVYGYKKPRSRRAKTMSSLQIAHDMMGLNTDGKEGMVTTEKSVNSKMTIHS